MPSILDLFHTHSDCICLLKNFHTSSSSSRFFFLPRFPGTGTCFLVMEISSSSSSPSSSSALRSIIRKLKFPSHSWIKTWTLGLLQWLWANPFQTIDRRNLFPFSFDFHGQAQPLWLLPLQCQIPPNFQVKHSQVRQNCFMNRWK